MATAPLRVAPLGRRFGASLLDGVALGVLWGLVAVVRGEPVTGWWWTPVVIAYTLVPTAVWGQTLGKLSMGIRVILDHRTTVEVPGWRGAGIREAVLVFPGLLPGVYGSVAGVVAFVVVVFGILTDDLGRGIHDTLAGTRVIEVRGRAPAHDRYRQNLRTAQQQPRPRRKRRRTTWEPPADGLG